MAKLAATVPINKIAKIAALTAEQSAESARGLPKTQSEIDEFAKIPKKTRSVTKIALSQLQLF